MIEIKNLSYMYNKNDIILKNINLKIDNGEIVSIIGKNGCGKSTLLKLIAGLMKPSTGNIFIDGIDIFRRKDFRKEMGIVFQNPDAQILFPKVFNDIEFALKNLKIENRKERIEIALKKVNLIGKEQENTYNLSLGQKQRINIASVLAINPKYILLDEPTTMIDSKEKDTIYQIMKDLKKDNKTIIFVTNNINEILLSDRIIILDNKEIKHTIEKNKLLENIQILQKCDIRIPDIIQVILRLKENGQNINLKEWTIQEMVDKIVRMCNPWRMCLNYYFSLLIL